MLLVIYCHDLLFISLRVQGFSFPVLLALPATALFRVRGSCEGYIKETVEGYNLGCRGSLVHVVQDPKGFGFIWKA